MQLRELKVSFGKDNGQTFLSFGSKTTIMTSTKLKIVSPDPSRVKEG